MHLDLFVLILMWNFGRTALSQRLVFLQIDSTPQAKLFLGKTDTIITLSGFSA